MTDVPQNSSNTQNAAAADVPPSPSTILASASPSNSSPTDAIPLEIENPSGEPPQQDTGGGLGSPPPTELGSEEAEAIIPECIFHVGMVDIVICLIVAAVVSYFMIDAFNYDAPLWPFLAASVAVFVVGAICGTLPMIASRKNNKTFMWLWFGASLFLMLIQLGILFGNPKIPIDLGRSIATAFCGLRLVSTLCVNFICLSSPSSDQGQQRQQGEDDDQAANCYAYCCCGWGVGWWWC